MPKLQRIYIMILIIVSCLGCDQVSKKIAKETLQQRPPISYLGETFRLQYAENTGAFLSLGSGLSKSVRTWLFTFLSGGLLIALTIYILINSEIDRKNALALSLILGGGTSNLIDRMLNDGKVVDFMNMGIGNLRTGIFNWADVVIMVGMGLIVVFSFTHRSPKEKDKISNQASEDTPEVSTKN